MLRLWSRSQHCQCLQEGWSPWPVASALGQSLPVTTPAGTSRPQPRLPDCLSTTQTADILESLLASLAPSLGTKPPSPSRGPILRTMPTIAVVWELVVTVSWWCEPVGKCYQNLPVCSEGSALSGWRGRKRGRDRSGSPWGGRLWALSPLHWFMAPCLLPALPRCVPLSRGPLSAHVLGKEA